jgi:hypothetical protein
MLPDRPDSCSAGAPFAAPSLSLTLDQARAFGAARVAAAAAPPSRPRPVGPPHLQVIENDFLRPSVRADGARPMGDWE